MGNFRRFIKNLNVNYGDFNKWADGALKKSSPHRKLFDSYDDSLRKVEVLEVDFHNKITKWIDCPDFDEKIKSVSDKLKMAQRQSVDKLWLIFDVYRKDRSR